MKEKKQRKIYDIHSSKIFVQLRIFDLLLLRIKKE